MPSLCTSDVWACHTLLCCETCACCGVVCHVNSQPAATPCAYVHKSHALAMGPVRPLNRRRVCSPYEILSPEPCFVFSLGCNGISGFEEDVKARYPHCVIHIYDPTTSERTAKEVMARTQVPPSFQPTRSGLPVAASPSRDTHDDHGEHHLQMASSCP